MKKSELHKLINEEINKVLRESWKGIDDAGFFGVLGYINSRYTLTYDSYPSSVMHNTTKMLTMIKEDEKLLNKKYPGIKYKINLGVRDGDLPFIEISK
jgi:hypothetical protein